MRPSKSRWPYGGNNVLHYCAWRLHRRQGPSDRLAHAEMSNSNGLHVRLTDAEQQAYNTSSPHQSITAEPFVHHVCTSCSNTSPVKRHAPMCLAPKPILLLCTTPLHYSCSPAQPNHESSPLLLLVISHPSRFEPASPDSDPVSPARVV